MPAPVETIAPEISEAVEVAAQEMTVLKAHINSLTEEVRVMHAAEDRLRDANTMAEMRCVALENQLAELQEKLETSDAKLRMTEDAYSKARGEWEHNSNQRRESGARSVQLECERRIKAIFEKQEEMKQRHKKDIDLMENIHSLKVQEINRTCAELRRTIEQQQATIVELKQNQREEGTSMTSARPSRAFEASKENPLACNATSSQPSGTMRRALDAIDNDGLTDEERVRLLKERNHKTLPHLQSSYALELQEAPVEAKLMVQSPLPKEKDRLFGNATVKGLPAHLQESAQIFAEENQPESAPAARPKAVVMEFSPQKKRMANPPRLTSAVDKRDNIKSLRPPSIAVRSRTGK